MCLCAEIAYYLWLAHSFNFSMSEKSHDSLCANLTMWLLVHATAWMISEHATSEIFLGKMMLPIWPNDKLPHAWISINFCPLCFSYTRRCVACETYHNLYVTCQHSLRAWALHGCLTSNDTNWHHQTSHEWGDRPDWILLWDWVHFLHLLTLICKKKPSLTVLNCTTVLRYQQLSWDKWGVDDLSTTQCNNRAEYTDYITTTTAACEYLQW